MRFPRRIIEIVNLIPSGCKMIDIGCDHCLLGIYLVKNKEVENIIASDINQEPLLQAEKNLARFGLEDTIKIRLGNGLEVIENNEVDTIVISGLGGKKIIEILTEIKVLNNIENIILQPNNSIYEVRRFLVKQGFYIDNEKLVEDNEKIYEIILFRRGKRKYNNNHLQYGPINLIEKNNLFKKHQIKKLETMIQIKKDMPKRKIIKKIVFYKKIVSIKKTIK